MRGNGQASNENILYGEFTSRSRQEAGEAERARDLDWASLFEKVDADDELIQDRWQRIWDCLISDEERKQSVGDFVWRNMAPPKEVPADVLMAFCFAEFELQKFLGAVPARQLEEELFGRLECIEDAYGVPLSPETVEQKYTELLNDAEAAARAITPEQIGKQ